MEEKNTEEGHTGNFPEDEAFSFEEIMHEEDQKLSRHFFEDLAFRAIKEGDKALLTILINFDVLLANQVGSFFYLQLDNLEEQEQKKSRAERVRYEQASLIGNFIMGLLGENDTDSAKTFNRELIKP